MNYAVPPGFDFRRVARLVGDTLLGEDTAAWQDSSDHALAILVLYERGRDIAPNRSTSASAWSVCSWPLSE